MRLKNKILAILALSLFSCNVVPVPIPIPEYLQIGLSATPQARPVVSCIVRIDENGNPSLLTTTGHKQIGVASVSNEGGALRIDFSGTHTGITSFHVSPDECTVDYLFAARAMPDHALISFNQLEKPEIRGRFVFDGTHWNYTQFAKTKPITLTYNTPTLIGFTHEKAELGYTAQAAAPNMPGLFLSPSEQYESSSIGLNSIPQAGATILFRRKIERQKARWIRLEDIEGSPFCNIQFTLFSE